MPRWPNGDSPLIEQCYIDPLLVSILINLAPSLLISGRPAGRGGLPGPVEEDGSAHLRQLHVRLRLQPGGHQDPLITNFLIDHKSN